MYFKRMENSALVNV